MLTTRSPAIRIHTTSPSSSSNKQQCCYCCCCPCFPCVNFSFLKTDFGKFLIIEAILGSFCESMVINGVNFSQQVGYSYYGLLSTASWCLMTTYLLLFCCLFSFHSCTLIRQTLFMPAFNAAAAFGYLSSCSYVGYIVNYVLSPITQITPLFQVYPSLQGSFILGTIAGLVHAYDAYKSYRFYKGYR